MKITASDPITSWHIDGERVETVSDFIWGGSKITVDGYSSHEIKRRLLLWRKVMTNLDSILKSKDITLPTNVRLVKAMVFPVVMYGCESWAIKKAACQRTDAFELWCWRRLLRVPWTARRSKQSILKDSHPECSWKECWSWNSNTLATWYEEVRAPTQWAWVWVNSRSWWWTGRPGVLQSWGCKESDTTERLNWTEVIFQREEEQETGKRNKRRKGWRRKEETWVAGKMFSNWFSDHCNPVTWVQWKPAELDENRKSLFLGKCLALMNVLWPISPASSPHPLPASAYHLQPCDDMWWANRNAFLCVCLLLVKAYLRQPAEFYSQRTVWKSALLRVPFTQSLMPRAL